MTRIILNGCCGKMGNAITRIVSERKDTEIAAGVDINEFASLPYPVFAKFSELNIKADLIIDFSNPSALNSILDYAVSNKLPLVIATTGLSELQLELIKTAAKEIPIFYSANMSLGISLLCELSKTSVKALDGLFDIEIVEAHHNQKLDAPSGTALLLAEEIKSACADEKRYEYDRHSKKEKRSPEEIGIHSIRGGTIVGEHQVIFAGHDEIITLSHTALSKDIFAEGAVNAGLFLLNKSSGLYSMSDLVTR
ncbi:MAG: 4-hydroxy-tetrahydrodipicolinate reductase [Acutalibacteraceae bacterium]